METTLLEKTFTAATAIAKYRIVTTSNKDYYVEQANTHTDPLIGVSGEFDVTSGERIDVKMVGIVRILYGTTINRGNFITSDANGKATPASSGRSLLGIALINGVANDIGVVLLSQAKY